MSDHTIVRSICRNLLNNSEEEKSFAHTIVDFLKKGKKIDAIKELRCVTGLGLREAKDLIEDPFWDDYIYKVGYFLDEMTGMIVYSKGGGQSIIVVHPPVYSNKDSLGNILSEAIYQVGAEVFVELSGMKKVNIITVAK